MILVSVGMHTQGFERLVRAADELAAGLAEPVVIQYGCALYEPKNAQAFRFTGNEEMNQHIQQARVVICHAGAGVLVLALKAKKKVIVVPRRRQYQEHFDDHQMELAYVLQRERRAVAVFDPSAAALSEALLQVETIPPGEDQSAGLCAAVAAQMDIWKQSIA